MKKVILLILSVAFIYSHMYTHSNTHRHTNSKPTYLKVSSILLHMLLHTQAQLLHPLQLGLDSGTVGLQQPSTGGGGGVSTALLHKVQHTLQLHHTARAREASRRQTEILDWQWLNASMGKRHNFLSKVVLVKGVT